MYDIAELRQDILEELQFGFENKEQIIQRVRGYYKNTDDEFVRILSDLYDEVISEWLDEQKNWPEVTDCDRLDRAFAAMERHGIVAQQYFSCCQRDGHADIYDELKRARSHGVEVKGYAFYSEADADAAMKYGRLNIAFGDVDFSKIGTLEIGKIVAEALRKEGFDVKWPEDPAKRIHISKINWQRRIKKPPGNDNALN